MEEKIKISIPKATAEILLKDAELFEFFKSNDSLNKNLFYNTLIKNYYEEYANSTTAMYSEISNVVNNGITSDCEEITQKLLKLFFKNKAELTKKESVTINFKPTKGTFLVINYIENVLIKNQSISSFYRGLFNSYISFPRNRRETIIFKENYDIINHSISHDMQIYFYTEKENAVIGSVYTIASSKDELFNYVLIERDNRIQTYRLSRIRNVKIFNKKREVHHESVIFFQRMLINGPQHLITNNDPEQIIIKLTKTGESLYKKIYLYRPNYLKKEGNVYTFDCSQQQALFYFCRFGQDVEILEPDSLIKYFYNFHRYAFFNCQKGINKLSQ